MYTLPELDYSYDAFESFVSKEIMELHHDNHHQTYIDKLNKAIEQHPDLKGMPLVELLQNLDSVPESIRTTVRNNGGGHYNHTLFWKFLSPNGGGEPTGKLAESLVQKYGSFDDFKEEFEAKAVGLFGSGWVWLQPDLSIVTSPNQDSPLMEGGDAPLLGLDVWEHAYYLDYTYKRPEYVKAWWDVVSWEYVSERLEQADDTQLEF